MKQPEERAGARLEPDADRTHEAAVTPLRKRRLSGELYTRDPKIEALIAELAVLPRDALIARAGITKRSDPDYIPSECLVYFVRASRHDNNKAWFERLYRNRRPSTASPPISLDLALHVLNPRPYDRVH